MQVFIDRSGNPHPNDPNKYSVLMAVCIREGNSRDITRELHNLRAALLDEITIRALLPQEKIQKLLKAIPDDMSSERKLEELRDAVELKATLLLGERSFRQVPKAWELAESVFELVRKVDLAAFTIVIRRPSFVPHTPPGMLPRQYQFLLQRVSDHMANKFRGEMATIIFDEEHLHHDREISRSFTNFMFKTAEGKSFDNILEIPLFVSSSLTPGVQLADLFAYCGRECYEEHIEAAHDISDPYLHAIKRFWDVIKSKTFDYPNPYGHLNYGIYEMEEKHFQMPLLESLGDAGEQQTSY